LRRDVDGPIIQEEFAMHSSSTTPAAERGRKGVASFVEIRNSAVSLKSNEMLFEDFSQYYHYHALSPRSPLSYITGYAIRAGPFVVFSNESKE
jgi:hypothetical protein